jgi:hypothetical protein
MRVTEYSERCETISDWPVRIVTYRLDDRYICTITNVDPGACIARGEGPTRDDAERVAVGQASRSLALTRRSTPFATHCEVCGRPRASGSLLAANPASPDRALWVCTDCQRKLARRVDDEVPGG